MKLFFIFLLSLLSYHCCAGYPVAENELSEDLHLENANSIESWLKASNGTTSNDSSPIGMHGVGKKVVEKVKEGIKTVKDKVKGGFDKIKDKIKDFKDKIGSKGGSGGGSGGGYYRDKYDRDYDRDRYDRDNYRKDRDYSGGGGSVDPNAQWIVLGITIVFVGVGLLFVIIMKLRDISKRKKPGRNSPQDFFSESIISFLRH